MILQLPKADLYKYSRSKSQQLKNRAKAWNRPADYPGRSWMDCVAWWGECCAYCGVSADVLGERLTADHIVPLKNPDGPGSVPANVIPSCSVCNEAKDCYAPGYFLTAHFGPRYAVKALARIQSYIDSVGSLE